MKKYFSWFMLLGIFFFGVTEWSRSLHRNFAKEGSERQLERRGLFTEFASIPTFTPNLERRRPAAIPAATTAIEMANRYLDDNREILGLKSYHEFRPVEFKTPLSTHVRYSVYESGVAVLNLGIEVEIKKDKTVELVDKQYWDLLPGPDVKEALPVTDLVNKYAGEYRMDASALAEKPLLSATPGSAVPELVYVVSGRDNAGKQVQLMIRAKDGTIAARLYSRSEFK